MLGKENGIGNGWIVPTSFINLGDSWERFAGYLDTFTAIDDTLPYLTFSSLLSLV